MAKSENLSSSTLRAKETAWIVVPNDYPGFQKFCQSPFLKLEIGSTNTKVSIRPDHLRMLEKLKTSPRIFIRLLDDVCIKGITNPGSFFDIRDSTVLVPSNMESAADSGVHRLLMMYDLLKIKLKPSEETLEVPTFSQGWSTNINWMTHTLYNIILRCIKGEEMIPIAIRSDASNLALNVLFYKWACRKNISAYLHKPIISKGNLSEIVFCDKIASYGTEMRGFSKRIASGIYQLIGLIAQQDGIDKSIPSRIFLRGDEIKSLLVPRRTIKVATKTGKKKTQEDVNITTNVLKISDIRFLLPKERSKLREYDQSLEIAREIREFDAKLIKDRDYPALEGKIKKNVADLSVIYFRVRRLARNRMYAMKSLKKELKQGENVLDNEFNDDAMLESKILDASKAPLSPEAKENILSALRYDILKAVSSDDTVQRSG